MVLTAGTLGFRRVLIEVHAFDVAFWTAIFGVEEGAKEVHAFANACCAEVVRLEALCALLIGTLSTIVSYAKAYSFSGSKSIGFCLNR